MSENTGAIIDKKDEARDTYIDKVLGFIELSNIKPLKIVLNSGNGAAGPTLDALDAKLKEKGVITNFAYVHHDPILPFQMEFLILRSPK